MSGERLRAFPFRLDRGRGFTTVVLFYAASAAEAAKHARRWARERGFRVEPVRDEELTA